MYNHTAIVADLPWGMAVKNIGIIPYSACSYSTLHNVGAGYSTAFYFLSQQY
jgi:hypothetical protein